MSETTNSTATKPVVDVLVMARSQWAAAKKKPVIVEADSPLDSFKALTGRVAVWACGVLS